MLNIWCVLNGTKYQNSDVHILKAMCERHAPEHRFYCLSDRPVSGVECVIPEENWPGWWSKLLLFKYAKGQCLYLDLDTVIVGDLTPLVSDNLSLPKNWALSGHGGWQSSVMSWCGDYPALYSEFDPEALAEPVNGNCGAYEGLWGDQEYITRTIGDNAIPMKGVYSYKYHCRNGLPGDARVICFHGNPKPSEVSDSWVKRSRYTLTKCRTSSASAVQQLAG